MTLFNSPSPPKSRLPPFSRVPLHKQKQCIHVMLMMYNAHELSLVYVQGKAMHIRCGTLNNGGIHDLEDKNY